MEKDRSKREENCDDCRDVLEEFLEKNLRGKERAGTDKSSEHFGGENSSSSIQEQLILPISHHHRHHNKRHKKHRHKHHYHHRRHHHHHHHHHRGQSDVCSMESISGETSPSREKFPIKSLPSCLQTTEPTAVGHSAPIASSTVLSATEYPPRKRKERTGEKTVTVKNTKIKHHHLMAAGHFDAESDSELSPTASLKSNLKYVTTDRVHDLATVSNSKMSQKADDKTVKTPDRGTLICSDPQLLPACRLIPHSLLHLFVSSDQTPEQDDSGTGIPATSSSLVPRTSETTVVGRKTDHTEKNRHTVSSPQTPSRDQGLENRALKVTKADRKHACPVCGKAFMCCRDLLSDLKDRMTVHTEEKPYTCLTCGKAFRWSGDLKVHIRIHTGEKPYTCLTCGKAFNQSGHLKKHIRVHTGERPYECQICSKAFSHSGGLKRHIRVHTRERPYKCQICGIAFSQMCHLKRHERDSFAHFRRSVMGQ